MWITQFCHLCWDARLDAICGLTTLPRKGDRASCNRLDDDPQSSLVFTPLPTLKLEIKVSKSSVKATGVVIHLQIPWVYARHDRIENKKMV